MYEKSFYGFSPTQPNPYLSQRHLQHKEGGGREEGEKGGEERWRAFWEGRAVESPL